MRGKWDFCHLVFTLKDNMALDIEKHLKPTIDWNATGYLWWYNLNTSEKHELTAILNSAYDVAKAIDKVDGDVWEALFFKAVGHCYVAHIEQPENAGREYDGFLLDRFDVKSMAETLVKLSREHIGNYRSMMNCFWSTLEMYKTDEAVHSEFLDWFIGQWLEKMRDAKAYRLKVQAEQAEQLA